MERLDVYRRLAVPSDRRILFMVIDGLGGLPRDGDRRTELEVARTPVLDDLARTGECGLTTPVLPGITPGSGPAHIALFGYDPVRFQVGRGVLAALGVGFELQPGDVAARINFCTLDAQGNIVDRRAGRISDQVGAPLAELLDQIDLGPDAECFVRHVKQYRACVVFRGSNLGGRVAGTDPQRTGVPPLPPQARSEDSEATAALASRFVEQARTRLADQPQANGVTLRGFDTFRPLPSLGELYRLDAAAVASYPMYRGVARLAGMRVIAAGDGPDELLRAAARTDGHDFVYLHYKATDSRGEDGNFEGKVAEIEKADQVLAQVREGFDVIMVTGDHSTPCRLRSHSWHPVPLVIWSDRCRCHEATGFGERQCLRGSLGHVRSIDVLPLVLAHADRLLKFGA